VDFFPSYADAAKLQEKLLMKGFSVQLKEKKYLGKRTGYSVFTGPFPDVKSEGDARTKLKKMGLNPAN
jgi:cell division protein FtsN